MRGGMEMQGVGDWFDDTLVNFTFETTVAVQYMYTAC